MNSKIKIILSYLFMLRRYPIKAEINYWLKSDKCVAEAITKSEEYKLK